MRTIILTKQGCGTVVMRQGEYRDGQKWYTIESNKIPVSMKNADAMNIAYRSYLKAGWKVKPEPKVAAPKESKGPKWTFPEGFDKDEYWRIANENRWTWCDARGKVHVQNSKKPEIYRLMGGIENY